jgi:peptidoglycan/xylan/chitin deacetylase (PgdA/CDA1 family)
MPIAQEPKRVLLTFDYEAHWGMPPAAATYRLAPATHLLLDVLGRHRASAVFFVVGRLAEEHPGLIDDIAARGHELALHGWRHENLATLDAAGLAEVERGLARAESLIERVTGRRPTGFRAPYLLWPEFYRREVYEMLAARGYRWVSNHKVRYLEELLRPDRRLGRLYPVARRRAGLLTGRASRALVAALDRRSPFGLRGEARPFHRDGLLEIPIHCPVDSELLGLPSPEARTTDALLEYASFALRLGARRSGSTIVYTFHDWLIASSNRPLLLEDLLEFLAEQNWPVCTVSAAWPDLLAESAPSAGRRS